jgi:hypothetical protein
MSVRTTIFAAALAAALVGSAAWAGVEHQPQSGTPAFEVDVPQGWEVTRDDGGNLYALAGDHSGGLVLNMVEGSDSTDVNLDDVAAKAMEVAQAQPYSRKAPATVGGQPAEAYYSGMGDGSVTFRLVLVKVDKTHIGSEGVMMSAKASDAQTAAVEAVAAGVHFVR